MRHLGLTTLISAAFLLLLITEPTKGASAAGYAYGRLEGAGEFGGGYVQVKVMNLWTPYCSSGAHINQTLWVGTNSSDYYWQEIGYTYGYHGSCVFSFYTAFNNPSQGYLDWLIYDVAPEGGTVHSLEVQQVYNGVYYAYIDNVMKKEDYTSGWTTSVDTGLEDSWDGVSETVNFDWHQVRNKVCCTWYYWPTGVTRITGTGHYWAWTQNYIHGYDY